MKKKILIIYLLFFLLNNNCHSQTHQINFVAPGGYFFNYAGYQFNSPFKFEKIPYLFFLPSISYQYEKKNNGFQISGTMYNYIYNNEGDLKNVKEPILISREGFIFSIDYLRNVYMFNKGYVKLFAGLSSEYTSSEIRIFPQGPNYWEGFYDQDRIQIGGLALNFGANFNYKLWRRLYFSSTLRSVNFIIGGKYQHNSIWWDNGIGYRFGKGFKK